MSRYAATWVRPPALRMIERSLKKVVHRMSFHPENLEKPESQSDRTEQNPNLEGPPQIRDQAPPSRRDRQVMGNFVPAPDAEEKEPQS